MYFLSPTDQKCAESSTFWQFFYYRPPGKLRQRERSLKRDAKNSTCIYIYRYHPLYNRYGFSISVQAEITSLLIFFSMLQKKNVFQKLAGLWLFGQVVNHVGLNGSKVAEGCSVFQRRSCYFIDLHSKFLHLSGSWLSVQCENIRYWNFCQISMNHLPINSVIPVHVAIFIPYIINSSRDICMHYH